MEKKYNCEVIQDLLPLYLDDACSISSRAIVEEHLAGCSACSKIAETYKNNAMEEQLIREKDSVLSAHLKSERKKTFTIGLWTSFILMIPVIVCLICNLAIGHGLDWFFIVLTALLMTASVTVVPLVVPKHTGLWTLGSFVISLLLLLLTICIYTRGNWFFIAAVPALFGLSVVFMPYVVYSLRLPAPFLNHKGLLVMIWDTVWLYAVIIVCGLYAGYPGYWPVALKITTFCLLLPWIPFIVIRYTSIHPLTKAGICTLFAGNFCVNINLVIAWILKKPMHPVRIADMIFWNDSAINAAVNFITLLITVPVGIALIACGWIKQRKKGDHQS